MDPEGYQSQRYSSGSLPQAARRWTPVAAFATFLIVCLVLNSVLISTPSASSAPFQDVKAMGASFLPSILLSILPYHWASRTKGTSQPPSSDAWPWPPHGPDTSCPFPLPNLLAYNPIEAGTVDRPLQNALDSLHRSLQIRTSLPDIDSLAIAVVTPGGTIFEKGYGVLKANDTAGKQYPVNKDSIYRIASVSKMFAVFEALLLREKGFLSLDDPVEKYIPDFRPPTKDWPEYLRDRKKGKDFGVSRSKDSRITLRQLASHTSGLGRDYPVNKLSKWPVPKLEPSDGDPERNSTLDNVLGGINKYPLVHLPYSYPIYSNAGFDMLGLALVAANANARLDATKKEPKTYKELIKRDIFDTFGLNSSFFRVPEEERLKDHIAVPAKDSQWADIPLGDTDDSAGGQYSSLSDLAKIAHVFLSLEAPSEDYEFLPDVMREWLRPSYTWPTGNEAVGAPWEISYLPPGPGHFYSAQGIPIGAPPSPRRLPGKVPIYSKQGNMPGYHSIFSLNPEYGYAVVVLVTGTYSKTDVFALEALRRLQPAFEDVLVKRVVDAYVGIWEPEGEDIRGKDIAEVRILAGQLFLTKLVVEGVDILLTLREFTREPGGGEESAAAQPVPLWSTGRPDEFRLALGRGKASPLSLYSCFESWATIDNGLFSRGASVDLVYWEQGDLVYPSAGVRFRRTRKLS